MQRIIRSLARVLFLIAVISLVTLLIVFPMVGTENGTHVLYAMRLPVLVSEGEYWLVMSLLVTMVAGFLGGFVCLLLGKKPGREKEEN